MRKLTPILIVVAIVSSFFFWHKPPFSVPPSPTNGATIIKYGEEETQINLREAWFELLHQAAPGTDWHAIEYQNNLRKYQQKIQLANSRDLTCGEEAEFFANDQVQGIWKERGSVNQAGSVFDTEYDAEADDIWLLSAGGTLFRGKRDGSEWHVINQDLRFNHGLLKFIPFNGERRLLAFSGRIPHYSDDNGLSWTAADGIQHDDSWGNFHTPVVLDDDDHTFYVLAKPSYWEQVSLYKSVDQGENFHIVTTFDTYDFDRFALHSPHHSNELFLVKKTEDNQGQLFQINPQTDELELINDGAEFSFGNARANISGWFSDTQTRFYAYSIIEGQAAVYHSEDLGQSWVHQNDLPAHPWSVGLYVSPSNPDVLLMGEVDCFRSFDAGANWTRVNNWWEYYGNEASKLHADMMHFAEFSTSEGELFILISHHGGLTISDDYLVNQLNISLLNLNVSQYYSVRTDPTNLNFVYGASQDQGFQVSNSFEDETLEAELFDQVISGDYGHIVFSNNGQALWTVYPGGSVSYYDAPQNAPLQHGYELESENETVWLPPLVSSPYPQENAIYMAGGSIDQGAGSYLIRLEASQSGIEASQGAFDFWTESGEGTISAIGAAPSNPHYWYVATTNGRLFYSTDGGDNWEQNLNFIPEGHYLYGQTIYVSKFDESTVYLGGSGYSNPAVYKSTDNGQNFEPMTEGLPSTLVFDLTANADESLLFAATENGPYVFVKADNRWYDLSGLCAPNQTYWSVEFVEVINTVRFGTYGRGIWDFQIMESVDADEPEVVDQSLNIFPNPSDGLVQVIYQGQLNNASPIRVIDASGKVVFQTLQRSSTEQLDLSHLPKGFYALQLETEQGILSKKMIIQ